MMAGEGWTYRVAVREGDDLWLLCDIERKAKGDVFVLIHDWDRHVSYHRDGRRHVKRIETGEHEIGKSRRLKRRIRETRILPTLRQRPDESFQGAENILTLTIQSGGVAMWKRPSPPRELSDVLEIRADDVTPGEDLALAIDLVEPGEAGPIGPWRETVAQKFFRDAVPWISVTLWKGVAL